MTRMDNDNAQRIPGAEVADVLLADGSIATIRRLDMADRPAVEALFGNASELSLYSRFFTFGTRIIAQHVDHLFDPASTSLSLIVAKNDEIVGIADAEPCATAEAEVAFLVDDRAHGLGIATMLLEHLAASARRSGIEVFVAEVLASNLAMLRVFADSGFHLERQTGEGVAVLRLSTSVDSVAQEAADNRDATAESRSLEALLYPESVAVVGASRTPRGTGRAILASIVDGGFTGAVYVVNPGTESIAGLRSYPSCEAVHAPIDLMVIAVPARRVMSALRDGAAAGVRAAVIVSSGFSEFDAHGRKEQDALVTFARQHDMRIVGPNCLGVLSNAPETSLNATFGCAAPALGGLAIASQSGGVGIAIMETMKRSGMGVASFVSLGNKADISGNDLIAAWTADPHVDMAALYLESFGNPLKFARLARRFSRRKPLLAIVGGRSAGGHRAGASHTAAAQVPGVATDALFARSGVIGCRSLEELIDTARLLGNCPLPSGSRLGILTNAGGFGVLAADAAAAEGLAVPEFSGEMRARLATRVAGTTGVSNPVDLGAGFNAEGLTACVDALIESDEIDAILVILVRTRLTEIDQMVESIRQIGRVDLTKPLLLVHTVDEHVAADHDSEGSARFESSERALKALSNACRYAKWRKASPEPVVATTDRVNTGVRQLMRAFLAVESPDTRWLSVTESKQLLGAYGIKAPEGEVAMTIAGARSSARRATLPVTLKAADPTIVHKTDRRLVITDLATLDAVGEGVQTLRERSGVKSLPVLVQHHVSGGVEVALGLVRDPLFGPLLMVAAGGVATDILQDRCFLMPPLDHPDALQALQSLRMWPLLAGHRGGDPADIDALITLIDALGNLALDSPEIVEMDLNPVIVTPVGLHLVDVKIRIARGIGQGQTGAARSLSRQRPSG